MAALHVTCETQWFTGVHAAQVVAGPALFAKYPVAHCAHCELVAEAQVTCDTQFATGVQAGHEVCDAPR